jgi:5'(3')-deoxyribonucleotidase
MRKRLLVDVDEVLADFQTPMFEALYELYGRRASAEDCEVWDCFSLMSPNEKKGVFSIIEHPGWCRALKPKDGAIEAIARLRELVDVYAVTSHFPTSRTWVHERDEWLQDHFKFDRRHIVHTSSKFIISGDAFLDDNPDHVMSWLRENPTGLAMLWHIPNTRNLGFDHLRVKAWDEVVEEITNHTGLLQGSDGPRRMMWSKAKRRAADKGLPFSIKPEDIIIPTHCPVLGIPLEFKIGQGPGEHSPSLDRIDRDKGYVPGNIAVISMKANRIKNDATVNELKSVLAWLESRLA